MIEMRTFPGLFVGRRTVMKADETPRAESGSAYACGECGEELARTEASFFRDVVVRCRCGEFNQL